VKKLPGSGGFFTFKTSCGTIVALLIFKTRKTVFLRILSTLFGTLIAHHFLYKERKSIFKSTETLQILNLQGFILSPASSKFIKMPKVMWQYSGSSLN